MKKSVESPRAPRPVGPYSQAIESEGFVFVSGQLGMDPETGNLADGVEAQARLALQNMAAILEAAGLDMKDVLKVTIFLVDMADFPRVNEVYASFFSEPYPARACVAVSGLPKGALVEMECIAAVD
ncbi:MAG: RidA family protein [candidate division WOR-3 bacterium]